jgi:hypothetical protein
MVAVAGGRVAREIGAMLFNPKNEYRRYRTPDEPLPTPVSLLHVMKTTFRVLGMMVAIVIVVTAIVAFRTWMWMPHSVQ